MEIKFLEVLVMPNGEILCGGISLGFRAKEWSNYLFNRETGERDQEGRVCEICHEPEDDDGRCGCTNQNQK